MVSKIQFYKTTQDILQFLAPRPIEAEDWWVQVKNFWPGLGQFFVAQVGSAIYGLGF